MARKLKTFTTSAGFFDLAVSAPSMKAALEAWGAESNLFNQGFARETSDGAIVEATMAHPGVVLRRPVGTDDAFTEDAEVSSAVLTGRAKAQRPKPRSPEPPKPKDRHAGRKAAAAYEKEQQRREQRERKEEAARQREGARRDEAIAAARAALDEAENAHGRIVKGIEQAQAALDKKSSAEEARWQKEREKLQDALRRAHAPRHLRLV
jgi:hypothetical protein